MGRVLVGMKREPHIPWDVLAGAIIGVELFDRLTIDGNRIRARARVAARIDKNVGDVRAIARDVDACRADAAVAVAGEWLCTGLDQPHETGLLDGRTARREGFAPSADQQQ